VRDQAVKDQAVKDQAVEDMDQKDQNRKAVERVAGNGLEGNGLGMPASVGAGLELDQTVAAALQDFKSSIHAWSEAAYSRPRLVGQQVVRRNWRLALGWAMGCFLVAGTVSGGLVERQHRQQAARVAAEQHAAEVQRQLIQQRAAKVDEEELMAQVDSDVSRQVPSALEPLARMMGDDEVQ
jgi:hypothetical protein